VGEDFYEPGSAEYAGGKDANDVDAPGAVWAKKAK